jgi:hypothetical protein
MDAYPGLTNKARSRGNDFLVAHAEQVITLYGAVPFVPKHPRLLISISQQLRARRQKHIRGCSLRLAHRSNARA